MKKLVIVVSRFEQSSRVLIFSLLCPWKFMYRLEDNFIRCKRNANSKSLYRIWEGNCIMSI